MVIRLYTSEFVFFLHELQMAVAVICFVKTNSCFNPNHLNLSFNTTDSATLLSLNMKGLLKDRQGQTILILMSKQQQM